METLTCMAIASELNRLLTGMRVAVAEQADAGKTLLIQLRGKPGADLTPSSGWIVVSSFGGETVLFFEERKPAVAGRTWPAPLSVHMERLFVRSVFHNGMNRVITLTLGASTNDDKGPSLHVELFSARARAYLVSPGTGAIVEAFAARREAGSGVLAGSRYSCPAPPGDKLDPTAMDIEQIRRSLATCASASDLVDRLFGVGGFLAHEVLAGSAETGQEPAAVLKEMLSQAAGGGGKGYVLQPATARAGAAGPPADDMDPAPVSPPAFRIQTPKALPFRPRALIDAELIVCPTVNEAVKTAFASRRKISTSFEENRKASRDARARLRRVVKTRGALAEELREAGRAHELRRMGELILAHTVEIPKGTTEIEFPDPQVEGGKLRVSLEPHMTAPENAAAHFKKARKLEKKLAFLPGRIDELFRMEESLRAELDLVDTGARPAGAETQAPGRPRKGPRRDKWPTGISPRRFTSSDGWLIYVGRDNRENEYLTFAFAKSDDFWFHAHGVAGSHAILRREGRKAMPSKACIEETASVAAYFSKGRTSQTVAVVFTEKKHVRKPRKGKPGTALVSHEKTVMVSPKLLTETGR